MTELKPCHVCGEKLEVYSDDEYGGVSIRHAKSTDCVMHDIEDVEMPTGSTIDDLINKVNIRPIEDALNKYIAELEQTRIADIEHGIFLGKPVKYWLQMQEQAVVNGRDKDINEILTLKKEIAELKRTLAKLEERNDKLEDLLHQIKNWCEAYPFDIAREPTQEETKLARKILKDANMSLSLFAASAMRRITTGITNEILGDLK